MSKQLSHLVFSLLILSIIVPVVTLKITRTPALSSDSLGDELPSSQSSIITLRENRLFAQNSNPNQLQKRTALVIGNADYEEAGKLLNPVNDANDIAAVLKELNFEVILITNVDLKTMEERLEQFNQKLKQGGVGLFYYAGHGVQVEGENYLIPLKTNIKREQDIRYEALPLGKVIGALEEAGNEANIVVLDACRNNPFSRRWRSSGRGLAPIQSAKGLLIAYATEPGGEALDGDGQRNGLYTSHLLKYIKTPNLDVEILFKQVRSAVVKETDGFQIPWESSSLIGSFIFNPTSQTETIANPTPTPQTTTVAIATPSPLPSSQPSPSPIIQRSVISKTTQVDYTPLLNLLKLGKWQEADEETFYLMLTASKRDNQGYLDRQSLEKFSCSDLEIIDYLWREYSHGKFGFSVQQNMWKKMGGNASASDNIWRRFAIEVGWKKGSEEDSDGYLSYEELTFKNDAPEGHLPVLGEGSSFVIRGWGKDLFNLISKCEK